MSTICRVHICHENIEEVFGEEENEGIFEETIDSETGANKTIISFTFFSLDSKITQFRDLDLLVSKSTSLGILII